MSRKKTASKSSKPQKSKAKKSSKRSSKKKSLGKVLGKWFLILSIWGLAFSAFLVVFFAYDLPDISRLEQSTRRPGVVLKAKDGTILATYGDLYGKTIRVEGLPDHVPNALLAVEDSRFYHHFGVDVLGLVRALYTNFKAGRVVQGGSTITQQLAKNFLFSENLYDRRDRSLRRKVQELILAIWLETKFTKKQILTIYLNRVYFGAGTYGISAASQKYFGKRAHRLSIYEAAVVAGLLKAPSRYSPLSNPERANKRAQVVLNRMVEAGFLSAKARKGLKDSKSHMLELKKSAVFGRYFADWIIEQVWSYVSDVKEDLVVQTTFDPRLQKIAEKQLEKLIQEKGKARNMTQGALIAMTPQGAVRALVGGYDYRKSQFNRAVQAKRQTGSAFKLFVYLAAFEKGLKLTAKVSDGPLKIGSWRPKNYGWSSRGEVSIKDAFAYSINTAAIRLAKYAGKKSITKMANRLGLSMPRAKDLSIALGTADASLLDMTKAYAVIANHGFLVEPYGIISIKDRRGRLLYIHKSPSKVRLISKETTGSILKLLQSVVAYGTGKRSKIGRPSAGKSGTSQNHKDAWFIGFTPDLVGGVWLGNDDNKPMKKVTGGNLPAEVWKGFMGQAHKNYPIHRFGE